MAYFLAILLILTSIFLILLVLIQRGRGGGLAGAFGGLGGQSAFGTKAGDLFTRVTIGAAAVWIVLCVVSVKAMRPESKFTGSPTQQIPGGDTSGTGTAAPSKSAESTDKGAADTGSAEKAPLKKASTQRRLLALSLLHPKPTVLNLPNNRPGCHSVSASCYLPSAFGFQLLLSMTGFGESHQQADGLAVLVEVRTINNRYFKFSMRSGEGYSALESQVEAAVRDKIKRGTVQVNLQVQRQLAG